MKSSTPLWAKFESVSRPEHTLIVGPLGFMDIVRQQLLWLNESYMGSHIRITIARTETELEQYTNRKSSKSMTQDEMNTDLDEWIKSLPPSTPDIDD